MRRASLGAALAFLVATGAWAQSRPHEKSTIGTQMPDVELIADDDSTFRVSALWGKPIIVSPIFTRCPSACSMITESLRDALRDIGEPGVGYEVLTLSFDPADDSAALRAYRERLSLPPRWRLATASADNRAAFLRAIDFNVIPLDEGGFAHPNLVVVLSPDLKVSSYLHGVAFDAGEVRAALEDASRRASLVARYRPFILLAAVMGFAAVAWSLYATRRRGEQKA